MLYATYLTAALLLVLWVAAVTLLSAPAFLRPGPGRDPGKAAARLRLTGVSLLGIGAVLLVGALGSMSADPAPGVREVTAKLGAVALFLGILTFADLAGLEGSHRR